MMMILVSGSKWNTRFTRLFSLYNTVDSTCLFKGRHPTTVGQTRPVVGLPKQIFKQTKSANCEIYQADFNFKLAIAYTETAVVYSSTITLAIWHFGFSFQSDVLQDSKFQLISLYLEILPGIIREQKISHNNFSLYSFIGS